MFVTEYWCIALVRKCVPGMACLSFGGRKRVVVTLGCVVLVCIFYWDVKIMSYLHHIRQPSLYQPLKLDKFYGWTWQCVWSNDDEMDVCKRVMGDLRSNNYLALTTCKMTCSPGKNIWPLPTGSVKVKNTTASFLPQTFKIDVKPVKSKVVLSLLQRMAKNYEGKVSKLSKKTNVEPTATSFKVVVHLTKQDNEFRYRLNIDESYKLIISQKGKAVEAVVKASTFLGAHHGMETLLQLVWWDDHFKVLKVLNNAVVSDVPIFTYRGLMLDTSKSFLPVSSILQTIEAMSVTKMNVLHWHLTGSGSFPFASKYFPGFRKYGTFSSNEIYTPNDIKEVVEYAEVHGVSVMMEVNAPAHNLQGWEWGVDEGKGNLKLCPNDKTLSEFCSNPPCGQLNPANDESYNVLVQVLRELYNLTKLEGLVHLGGDGVDFHCWERSEEVTDMEVFLNKGMTGVWEVFYQQLFDKLSKEKFILKNAVLWTNELLKRSNFWKSLKNASPIVHFKGLSTSNELVKILNLKYRVIVSSSDVWGVSDAQNWVAVYKYRPWADLKIHLKKLVLGGEALAWADHLSLSTKLWPTTAAVAERLWSDYRWGSAPLARLDRLRERLLELGVPCSPVGPKWCTQNPYKCS